MEEHRVAVFKDKYMTVNSKAKPSSAAAISSAFRLGSVWCGFCLVEVFPICTELILFIASVPLGLFRFMKMILKRLEKKS